MLTGLMHLHSGVRWIVVLLTLIVLVRMLAVYLQNKEQFTKGDTTLLRVYLIAFDIQVLIGILFFATWAVSIMPIEPFHWEHAATMIIAAVCVHLSARFKNSPAKIRARNTLILVLLAALFVAVGVARLPQGWSFMPSAL